MKHLAALMIASLCAFGCASTSTSPSPPPDDDTPPVVEAPKPTERYERIVKALARELTKAGEDCGAVARAMTAWTNAHSRELRVLLAELDAWEADVGPYESRDYYKALFPFTEARIDAGMRCDAHPAAKAAYERFYEVSGFD